MIKKFILLLVLVLLLSQSVIFANEKENNLVGNNKISFNISSNILSKKITLYSTQPSKGAFIAGVVVGSVGAGLFGLNWLTCVILSVALPPLVTYSMDATLEERPLAIAAMATGWIPVFGPFINAGLIGTMMVTPLYSFENSYYFYSGMLGFCITMGIIELITCAMMITGFVIAGANKNYKRAYTPVMPIIGSGVREKNTFGVIGLKIQI